jgi:hypothetical protein
MNPYREKIKRLEAMAELWDRVPEGCPASVSVSSALDENILIQINTLKDLGAGFKLAKEIIPEWSGSLGSVWCVAGNAIAEWRDVKNRGVVIWLEGDPENFPIQSERCRFVETTRKEYDYVCETGGES